MIVYIIRNKETKNIVGITQNNTTAIKFVARYKGLCTVEVSNINSSIVQYIIENFEDPYLYEYNDSVYTRKEYDMIVNAMREEHLTINSLQIDMKHVISNYKASLNKEELKILKQARKIIKKLDNKEDINDNMQLSEFLNNDDIIPTEFMDKMKDLEYAYKFQVMKERD